MNMNKFALGAVAGMSSLALAVPLLAQVSGAQSVSSAGDAVATLPTPSQACLQAMATLEEAHLANFDTMQGSMKADLQTRITALKAAAAITDEAGRQSALKQMHDDQRAAMEARRSQEIPAAIQTAMDAVKSACGDTMMFRGGHKGGFGGPGMMMGPMGGHMRGKRDGTWTKPATPPTDSSSSITIQ